MAKRLPRSVYRAINQEMTPEFNRWAKKKYGMTGKRLLAKVYAVEGGGSIDEGTSATSYAGARGPGQFIASTRDAYRKQYGVDPWKNDRSAVRGSMIHLKGTGVAGYNPGMPEYEGMVLGAKVDTSPLKTGGVKGGGGRAGRVGATTRGTRTRTVTTTPGVDLSAERAALKQQLVSGGLPSFDELLEYKRQKRELKDIPGSRQATTRVKRRRVRGGGGGGGGRGPEPRGSLKDGWKGSKTVIQPAREVAKRFGMPISSEKRATVNTASGNVSDHYIGNKAAYALDISTTHGHKAARRIAKRFGMSYTPDVWNNKVINVRGRKYRVQIGHGQNLADHADHIHVGVRRV